MTSRNKYSVSKVRMSNWVSITEFSKKTTKNWRDNFRIDKNHPERSYLNPKSGKMFTTT
jgi:hypothetical protein